MEIIIAIIAIVAIGALVYFNRTSKSLDINQDGKVDLADAQTAVKNAVDGAKELVDVNNDGVIDAKDAEVVVEAVKEEAKKTVRRGRKAAAKVVEKAGAAVKKPRGRKPKA